MTAFKSNSSSAFEYAKAVAEVDFLLSEAQLGAQAGIDVNQLQLDALKQLVAGSLNQNESTATVVDLVAQLEKTGVDAVSVQQRIEALQAEQATLLANVDDNTLSISEAINQLNRTFSQSPGGLTFGGSVFNDFAQTVGPNVLESVQTLFNALPSNTQTQTAQITAQPVAFSSPVLQQSVSAQPVLSNAELSTLVTEVKALHKTLEEGQIAIATHTSASAQILRRFDDGDAIATRERA